MRRGSLKDIERAAELIARFTGGKQLKDHENDEMLRAAVEREFGIIGEALVGLRRVDEAIAARGSELRRIIAFRNILIHGYAEIDHVLVWDIVVSKLPSLRAEVDSLLASP